MIHKYNDALVNLLPEICIKKAILKKQTLWHVPVIPALRRMRQEDGKFEVSLREGESGKKSRRESNKDKDRFL